MAGLAEKEKERVKWGMATVTVSGCGPECEADVVVWNELKQNKAVAGEKFTCLDCGRVCVVEKKPGANTDFVVEVKRPGRAIASMMEGLLGLNGR